MGSTSGPAGCFIDGPSPRMITIFTPSFADETNTNAQNLTVKEVVARLDPEKFHVTMLCEGTADPRIAERPNTKILRWDKHGNTIRIMARLLQGAPQVYFFPREGPLDSAFLQARHWLRLGTALVTYVVSGGQLESGVPRPTLARNIREAQAVVGNSKYLTHLLGEKLGITAKTIYDGVDRRYFFPPNPSAAEAPRDPKRVLFAGSFRAYKRANLVVEHAARWPEMQFRIAGTGEEERACRELGNQLGCQNVSFLGHLAPQQLGEEMRRASVFLFPSIIEGHPQVLLQAAACGLPSVAMSSYRPEYVVDGKTGYLAKTDSELAERLDALLRNQALRIEMGLAAAEHSRNFEWDHVTRAWSEIFEAVLVERGSQPR